MTSIRPGYTFTDPVSRPGCASMLVCVHTQAVLRAHLGALRSPTQSVVYVCSPHLFAAWGGHVQFSDLTFHSFTQKDLQASTAQARRERVPAVWKSSEQPFLLLPANRVRFPGHKQWSLAPGEETKPAEELVGHTGICTHLMSHKRTIWYIYYVCF